MRGMASKILTDAPIGSKALPEDHQVQKLCVWIHSEPPLKSNSSERYRGSFVAGRF
jgi:hypothetical protein